jgi:hypothetical protein
MDGESHHPDGRSRTDQHANAVSAEHGVPPKFEL